MSTILVNQPSPHFVAFGDIITATEAESLRQFVAVSKSKSGPLELQGKPTHEAIMVWIEARPDLLKRWKALKLPPGYAGYLLEYHLVL